MTPSNMKTLLYCSILIVLSNHAKILTIEGFKRVLLGGENLLSQSVVLPGRMEGVASLT